MRNIVGLGMVLCTCIACTTPPAAQPMAAGLPASTAPACRTVVGQAEIDGTPQQIVGRACQQPDGTWQFVQDWDDGALAVYPLPAYPYWPYYDPWYWGPPVAIGVGGSFFFVNRFHHFHHMDHVHYGHSHTGMGTHGGFHGMGAAGGSSWGGMGAMSGGAGRH